MPRDTRASCQRLADRRPAHRNREDHARRTGQRRAARQNHRRSRQVHADQRRVVHVILKETERPRDVMNVR